MAFYSNTTLKQMNVSQPKVKRNKQKVMDDIFKYGEAIKRGFVKAAVEGWPSANSFAPIPKFDTTPTASGTRSPNLPISNIIRTLFGKTSPPLPLPPGKVPNRDFFFIDPNRTNSSTIFSQMARGANANMAMMETAIKNTLRGIPSDPRPGPVSPQKRWQRALDGTNWIDKGFFAYPEIK